MQLAEASGEADGIELTDLLLNLGDAYGKSGDLGAAIEADQRAIELLTDRLPPGDPALVTSLAALADLQRAAHRFDAAEATLQRILDIQQAAYGPNSDHVLATLGKLQQLYADAAWPEDAARIEKAIEAASLKQRELPATPAATDRARRYRASNGFATVRVFYGTNRKPTGERMPALFYGGGRGDLQYGYVDVSIPETHKEGELETQSRWSVLTYFMGADALKRRFVLLQDVRPLSSSSFAGALRSQITGAPSRDVFIFVHGFNSSFEDAARRTAQLAYDLDFDGTPMMYSWPSQASTAAYTVDEAAVGISGRRMADFLKTVLEQSGAERVHLIAHSMGNRALMEALQTYLAERPARRARKAFGQIVFTAPDVDRDYFSDAIEPLRAVADRVTLYASSNDLALRTSQAIHGAPRAGLGGDGILIAPGIDSIDMSEVQADMIGHNYYAANSGAIYDLFRILWRGDPPPRRCGMVDRKRGAASFWLFKVSQCKGTELLEAGVLVKRFGAQARERVRARLQALTDPAQKQEWTGILSRLNELLNAPLN